MNIILLFFVLLVPTQWTADTLHSPDHFFSTGGAYSSHHSYSRNEVISKLYEFYGVAGKVQSGSEILPFLSDEEFEVKVDILKREINSPEEYAKGLEGLRKRYPRIDRTIDRVKFEFMDEGRYKVKFRLTSQLYKPDEDYFLTFRAAMEFQYKESDQGDLKITYYHARPKIPAILGLTGAKRVYQFFKTLFQDDSEMN